MKHRQIIKNITAKLKTLDIEKAILFGSYAWGKPNEDSDVDLYLVTNDDYIPQNYREKSEMYLRVAREFYELEKSVPIDLIVHSKPMNKKFSQQNSMFARKIFSDGKALI
jgi:uncharacterized protein